MHEKCFQMSTYLNYIVSIIAMCVSPRMSIANVLLFVRKIFYHHTDYFFLQNTDLANNNFNDTKKYLVKHKLVGVLVFRKAALPIYFL